MLIEEEKFDVVLFNRGITHPTLFPEVFTITGDRETSDIEKVLFDHWDAVIDISGYYPDSLESFLPKLKGRVGRYIYVSTVSVYDRKGYPKDDPNFTIKEDHPLVGCTEEQRGGSWSEHYGEKKAECERIIQENHWLDSVILRPSIVYGRYDYTERYYYWLQRIKMRDEILIPNDGVERGNMTFVDDLSRLLMSAVTLKEHSGVYNAVTHPINSLNDKLDTIADVMGKDPVYYPITGDELKAKGFEMHNAFPCTTGRDLLVYDTAKTEKDFGISFTSYRDSVVATMNYYDLTTKWELGSRGLRYEEEDNLLDSLE
jgi:2'-hydroxyisoflavone reductase